MEWLDMRDAFLAVLVLGVMSICGRGSEIVGQVG
jgi:hypothetical protein